MHSADKLAEMRTKFHVIQAKLIMSVWCFTLQCDPGYPRLVARLAQRHQGEGGDQGQGGQREHHHTAVPVPHTLNSTYTVQYNIPFGQSSEKLPVIMSFQGIRKFSIGPENIYTYTKPNNVCSSNNREF